MSELREAAQAVVVQFNADMWGTTDDDMDRAIAALHNAAEELIRDARKWREYEADMRRAINVEAEQS